MVRCVANVTKRCGLPQFLAAIGLAAIGSVAPARVAAGSTGLPPVLVPEGATPFLRAHAVGTQNYVCIATGADRVWRFAGPRALQRINTSGGVAPSTGCSQPTDAGEIALVPYSTDYVFFR
jgi:hypothetical protein